MFDEFREGDFRVYVGALDAPRGPGFIAALVVDRICGSQRHEAYRDDSLACGYRWESAREALSWASNRARDIIQRERHRLLR